MGGTLDALFENQDVEVGDNVGFADFAHPPRQKRTKSKDKKSDVIKESHVVKKMCRMVILIENPQNMFQGEPTGRTLSDDSGREEKN